MAKHRLCHCEGAYIPPTTGYIFPAKAGSARHRTNYIASHYKVKPRTPTHLTRLKGAGAKHNPWIPDLAPAYPS